MKAPEPVSQNPRFRLQLKAIEAIMAQNRRKDNKIIYLFLDFDGVVNVFLEPGTPAFEEALRKKEFDFASRDCLARLNRLCHDFPIRIVISSSWRYSGLDYCRDYLMKYGLDEDVVLAGMTSITSWQRRPLDIADYLVGHQDFCGFLVLDDMDMSEFGIHDLVMNPLKGYDKEQDEKARQICTGFLIEE